MSLPLSTISVGGLPQGTVHSRVESLYLSASPGLRRYLRSLGASPEEVEDAVALAFEIYLTQALAGKEPDTNPSGYLFTVAKRQVYKMWGTKPAAVSIERDDADVALPVTDETLEALERTLVGTAFVRLSEADRKLVWLLQVEDRSAQEVADIMGTNANNVRTQFHRAKQAFRRNYLDAFAREPADDRCLAVAHLLSRVVLGQASTVQERKLSSHLAECDRCSRVLLEVQDEAACIRRIPIAIWGPVGLGALLVGSVGGGATRASAATILLRLISALVGTVLIVLGLLSLSPSGEATDADADPRSRGALARESSGDEGGQGSESAVADASRLADAEPAPAVDPAPVPAPPSALISVAPAMTALTTPAPGHSEQWTMTATNVASKPLPVYLEVRGYNLESSEEDLLLTLSAGGVDVVRDVLSSQVVGRAIRVDSLAPGDAVSVVGTVSRDAGDVDEGMNATVDFRFSTETELPGLGVDSGLTGGTGGELTSADGEPRGEGLAGLWNGALALTGARGQDVLLVGSGVVLLGLSLLVGRRRSA